MTPERWARIAQLCHDALERDEAVRDAFLREACGDDEDLRVEVHSLLRFDTASSMLLEAPVADAAAKLVASSKEATTDSASSSPNPPATGARHALLALRAHPFRPALIVLSLVPLAAFLFGAQAIWRHGARDVAPGWDVDMRGLAVSAIEAGGPADGRLQIGDRILAIDGDDRVSVLGSYWKLRHLEPGRPYTVAFERGGRRSQDTLAFRVVESDAMLTLFCRALVGLAWAMMGVFVGFMRPDARATRLMAIASLSVGTDIIRGSTYSLIPFMGDAEARVYGLLLLNTALPVALVYHAAHRFPPGVAPGRFSSAALGASYVAAALVMIQVSLTATTYLAGPDVALPLERLLNSSQVFTRTLSAAATGTVLALVVAVTTRNFRIVRDPDQRRRVKWIALAFTVSGCAQLAHAILQPGPRGLIAPMADLTTITVPMAIAYGVLRHRVFDIAVVVRIGIQHLLARNALRLLLAVPIVAMLALAAANPDVTIREMVVAYPAYPFLAMTAIGGLTFRRRLALAIDRRFFREAYDRERLLQAILDDIDLFEADRRGMAQITERLDAALHPSSLSVWFCADDRSHLQLAHSHGAASAETPDACRLPAPLVHRLEHDPRATLLSSVLGDESAGDAHRSLEELRAEYVIPMIGRDGRLRGAVTLGAKRSEEQYTPADLALLQRIARQIAAAREHGELRSGMDEQLRVRQEVLGHIAGRRIALLKECPACGTCYDVDRDRCDADGSELTFPLPVERTIAGRYRLERLIGRGGMGAVYEALDDRLQRRVAVKLLVGRHFGNRDALRRFDREARAVARLSHPNIISVFDYGTVAAQGAFLVMELVAGRTLRAALADQPSRPSLASVGWIGQILDAVIAAHAHGIIHRDLKPENVLVFARAGAPEGIKVLDFGLATFRATAASDEAVSVTAAGLVMGTPAYMAPEQMLGQRVDERADLFALGVMVYELMTGERPFSARPLVRVAEIPLGIRPTAFADASLRDVLARCLAEDPTRRYATVADARHELLPALARFVERSDPAEARLP